MLYVGGGGVGACRLLALDGTEAPVEIFRTVVPGAFLSIRAITEHDASCTWASEDAAGAALWVSRDPLGDARSVPPAPV